MWTPFFESFTNTDKKMSVEAKAALVYDLVRERVLFEKNSKERLPMASLTKIMTAIVALEDPVMPQSYYVVKEDLVGEDSMGLEVGEVLSKEELLYGLLMNSGNDAAEVLAHNYPTGRNGFLKAMQDKAAVLGLKDTHFSNPSGLQGDGVQFTTSSDLLTETKYAIDNFPLFKQIVSTYEHTIPANATHKEYYLTNETNLLSSYPGVKGVKTGYTSEAGLCLVTYYENANTKLIGVLLNSPNRRGEMKELLDYSLQSIGIPPPPHD
jgi:serine-type D-Ala-D-Ala carboxypeptidase (penicillin-binding protein 5/6)